VLHPGDAFLAVLVLRAVAELRQSAERLDATRKGLERFGLFSRDRGDSRHGGQGDPGPLTVTAPWEFASWATTVRAVGVPTIPGGILGAGIGAVHLQLTPRLGFQVADGRRDVTGQDGRIRPARFGERVRRDVPSPPTALSEAASALRGAELAVRVASRLGGAPNMRRYSRLNCDGLS
jgi:hypothetical protein